MGLFIDAIDLLFLSAFLVYGYVLTHIMSRYKGRGAFWLATGSLLFLFVYLRQYTFLYFMPYPENLPFIIGLSYIFFRGMQLVIDVHSGDIQTPPSPLRYFNFTCNFLMILSGPIQRYQEYIAQEDKIKDNKVNEDEALSAITRILIGYAKVGPLSAALLWMHEKFLIRMNVGLFEYIPQGSLILGATASFYTLFLYMNFSGYTDIVIGIGRLFGLKPPENFNKPFRAENFIDLWQRWHMSLANWMKIYVFNPTLKFLAYRIKSPAISPYLSAIAFFVTFLLLGSWHGPSLPFLLCGLMLGAAMAVNKLYQVELKKRLGREKMKALQSAWLYRQLCFGLTFMWLAFSIVGFWADWDKIVTTSIEAGTSGIFLSFSITVTLAAIVRFAFTLGISPVWAITKKIEQSTYRTHIHYAGLSLLLLGLYFYFQFWRLEVVEFVYKGF